ncbi:MAG: L,D-transpeptidase family protein [Pseudomonadota bacterium]
MTDLVVTRWGARYGRASFPCAIGRGGIGHKLREGDGITPAGVYPVCAMKMFARADRIDPRAASPTHARDIWSDDPADPLYNSEIRPGDPSRHPWSHERLWRADPLYDLVIDIGYDGGSGGGSAIFLHVWRKPRHPTAGCVAFRLDHLRWLAAQLGPRDRLVIQP